jgi:ABC-type Co2+ transport system permease subunit
MRGANVSFETSLARMCNTSVTDPAYSLASSKCWMRFEETLMKADRFVAFVTAGLITLFLAGIFTHEKVGAPPEQTHAAVLGAAR